MSAARIEDPAARRAYVLGGDAVFTVVGRTSRFTYRVEASKGNAEKGSWKCWFVSLMTGPDNDHDFCFIGTVFEPSREGGEWTYRPGRRSTIRPGAPGAAAFAWTWRHLGDLEEHGAEFWHSGRCSRCGKMLSDPESISAGLGPVCRGKAA